MLITYVNCLCGCYGIVKKETGITRCPSCKTVLHTARKSK